MRSMRSTSQPCKSTRVIADISKRQSVYIIKKLAFFKENPKKKEYALLIYFEMLPNGYSLKKGYNFPWTKYNKSTLCKQNFLEQSEWRGKHSLKLHQIF